MISSLPFDLSLYLLPIQRSIWGTKVKSIKKKKVCKSKSKVSKSKTQVEVDAVLRTHDAKRQWSATLVSVDRCTQTGDLRDGRKRAEPHVLLYKERTFIGELSTPQMCVTELIFWLIQWFRQWPHTRTHTHTRNWTHADCCTYVHSLNTYSKI